MDVCNIVLPFQTIEQIDEPRLFVEEIILECRKIAVKVVDIFGNDTMTIIGGHGMTHFAPLGHLVVFWRLPRALPWAITFWAFGPESHCVRSVLMSSMNG